MEATYLRQVWVILADLDKSATRSSKAAAHRRGSRPLPDVPSLKWSHIQHRRPLINMKELTKLGTLNVRTLSCRWRLGELTFAAAKMGITALGIQEHRLQCTEDVRHMDMGRGWKLVHSTADARRVGGVGLLLSPRAYSALEAVTLISTRILLFSFTTSNRSMPKLTIIVCYSPTSASSEVAIDNFYSDLQKTVDSIGRHTFLSILGDWNARLQQTKLSPWVFSNEPNSNSERFVDFLSANSLFSANTVFRKRKGKLYTHKGPGGILSQIDHVVFRQKYRNSIKDCQCVTFRPFETDHRLVVASAQLSIRAAQPRRNPNHRRDWTQLRNPATLKSFRISCKNRYATLARGGNHKERYTAFVSAITSAADDHIPFVKPKKKRVPWEDADVERARVALAQAKSAHRRHRNDANMANVASASLALACQYTANQEKYISGQIDRIQAADESRKSSEVGGPSMI